MTEIKKEMLRRYAERCGIDTRALNDTDLVATVEQYQLDRRIAYRDAMEALIRSKGYPAWRADKHRRQLETAEGDKKAVLERIVKDIESDPSGWHKRQIELLDSLDAVENAEVRS